METNRRNFTSTAPNKNIDCRQDHSSPQILPPRLLIPLLFFSTLTQVYAFVVEPGEYSATSTFGCTLSAQLRSSRQCKSIAVPSSPLSLLLLSEKKKGRIPSKRLMARTSAFPSISHNESPHRMATLAHPSSGSVSSSPPSVVVRQVTSSSFFQRRNDEVSNKSPPISLTVGLAAATIAAAAATSTSLSPGTNNILSSAPAPASSTTIIHQSTVMPSAATLSEMSTSRSGMLKMNPLARTRTLSLPTRASIADHESSLTSLESERPSFADRTRQNEQNSLAKVRDWVTSTVVATIILSLLQAAVALVQYRSNPVGHLVIPAGPTRGVAKTKTKDDNNDGNRGDNEATSSFNHINHNHHHLSSWMDLYFSAQVEEEASKHASSSTPPYYDWLQRGNRFLVLLLPFLAHQLNALVLEQAHLLYLGVLFSMFQFWNANAGVKFDVETTTADSHTSCDGDDNDSVEDNPVAQASSESARMKRVLVIGDSLAVGLGSIDRFKLRPPEMPYFQLIENPTGNSTAIHTSSNNTVFALALQDATSSSEKEEDDQRPVFPRVLAEALAEKEHCSVEWRSAGVDGGAVSHIREYCLPVLQQEVDQGRTPDYIVVLCGMNDLKYQFAEHPWNAFSPQTYRRNLARLFRDIRSILQSANVETKPKTRVILPAMPVQLFLKNSAVGIFPLAFILGIIVGYWDSQKKLMADRASSSGLPSSKPSLPIEYLPMARDAVREWYSKETLQMDSQKIHDTKVDVNEGAELLGVHSDDSDTGFVSADGIHPNAKCYALWAEYVANHLAAQIA